MTQGIHPEEVESFLRDNPDFLQERPALLAALNLPHGGGGAVSLVERQVAILRERNIASRQKLAELTDIGRENDRLLEATRHTILALLAASDKSDITELWHQHVTDTFGADLGTLIWFGEDDAPSAVESVARKLTGRGEGVSGVLRHDEMTALFADASGDGSAAVSCLRQGEDIVGVIAVGSHDTQRYQPEDGTLFLDYLAEVISQLPACQ